MAIHGADDIDFARDQIGEKGGFLPRPVKSVGDGPVSGHDFATVTWNGDFSSN